MLASSSPLSLDAKPYVLEPEADEPPLDNSEDINDLSSVPVHKRVLGRRLYARVITYYPNRTDAAKITGMLLELSPTQLIYLLTHEEPFKERMVEAYNMMQAASSKSNNKKSSKSEEKKAEDPSDNAPLFYQPGKIGYYSPCAGRNGIERLSCFRNVGRILGLSLQQNELNLMTFNRHVIKYLIGRKVAWHDLAFFDSTLYESLRQLLADARRSDSREFFSALELTYCVQLPSAEGGCEVELIRGGRNVEVTPDNVFDYVKRYAEYRMVTVARRPLQAMRRGLLDVIPAHQLENLTAEDFRLLLNGAGDIVVQQLISYTFFKDETAGEGQEKLSKFKKWFWSLVENMTVKQKQDLLYFWTSSPAMPASAEGFQPMPSVTVKPSNDHQLPTANTCISRLYVPLYSSKQVLRSKLLLAIKTKVFGFV